MEIKGSGSQPSNKGPIDWFTGAVRIDPLFEAQNRHVHVARASRSSPARAQHGIRIHSVRRYRHFRPRLGAA